MMHIVVRLLPQDVWHEFHFAKHATMFELKIRALQHFGLLDRLEPSWVAGPARPSTPNEDSSRASMKSSTNGSQHRRRKSLIPNVIATAGGGPVGNLEAIGRSTDLVKAAETAGTYAFTNVCAGNLIDDQKVLGTACVDFDLLILQQRHSALVLPLEGFCYPYLHLPCLIQRTRDPKVAEQPRAFRPFLVTVFNNHIWLSRTAKDPQTTAHDLQSATCTVAPANSANGNGSKNVLKVYISDEDESVIIKTAREEDWPALLEVLGPEGAGLPFSDKAARVRWREEVWQRAQRSNQGLLPPSSLEEPFEGAEKPNRLAPAVDSPTSLRRQQNSSQKVGKTASDTKHLDWAEHRLRFQRSKTDFKTLEASPDIAEAAERLLRRSRSFSMPPTQAKLYDSGFGTRSINMRFADLPASPEAKRADRVPRSPPKTALPAMQQGREVSSHAPLPKLVARDLRYQAEERKKFKRWNEPDSDSS